MTIRGVSLAALLADQATKWAVLHLIPTGVSVEILPGYLYFTHVRNPGAAFGFLAGADSAWRIPFFILVTLGAGLVVYAYQRFVPPERKFERFSLGLIWGGAMGNFVDRMLFGQVVDFLDARYEDFHWYVFNVADSCITVGIVLLILYHVLHKPAHPLEKR